ncbi:MAG: SGNH/GDSL hydrolase family protein [Flavobacterium sp.]
MRVIAAFFLLMLQLVYSQNDKAKSDWPNLQKYAEENKTLMDKQPNTKRVVLMGDSITEFWKPTDAAFFSQTGYIDRGISGQTTPQMLLRFRQDVIDIKADAVVILAGINDIAENTGPIALEDVMGNIISMAELAKANKIKVVLCSVLPANKFWWNHEILPADKVIALNFMIKDYAKKNNITYIEYYSPMVDPEKGLDKKWADDGVHPNLNGYRLMEPLLVKAVEETLKKK